MANVKHRGLNRGLEHLLGDLGQEVLEKPNPETLRQIDLNKLKAGKYQPRTRFNDDALSELAMSIAEHGILQPLVVRPVGSNGFEIIAGERRFRAAQKVGLTEVPCVVKNYTDKEALAVALIENLQRSDLNVLEVAIGLQKLSQDFGLTHEKVAKMVGRSRSSVSNLLRLLDLSAISKQALADGEIEMGHARALLTLKEEEQKMLTREIIQKHYSVRQTEQRAKNLHAPIVETKIKTVDVQSLEEQLSHFMGYQVAIEQNKKGNGKLVLQYKNLDELEAILEKWGYKSIN